MKLAENALAKKVEKEYGFFLLTLLLLVLIYWQLDFKVFRENLSSIFSFQLFLAFVVYLVSYFLRALRWQFLLGKEFPLLSVFHIVVLHTVSNNVFPFRSGELTFPYFCKRFHGIPVGVSAPTLLSARLADVSTLGPLFFFSFLFLNMPVGRFFVLLLVAFVFLVIALTLPHILTLIQWIMGYTPLGERVEGYLSEAKNQYTHQWRGRKLAGLLSLSFSIWAVKFAAFYLIASRLLQPSVFHLTYWKVVLGSTASELIAALPLQTFAEFGMFEAGWAGAFVLMGMGMKSAVTLGFSLHIAILSFSLIVGLPGYVMVFFRKGARE
jgi:uncharacterized membrane protein YbhN (UPF0104 family)